MLGTIFDFLTDASNLTDARMDRFLLVSPLQFIIIIATYLLFVYKWGPKFMEHRKPYDLKPVLVVYNVVQILWNFVIFWKIVGIRKMLNVVCTPYDTSNNELTLTSLDIHHSYVLLKYFDLVETGFFILRKKERQISFLHVYHHVGTLFAAFFAGKYFPGGQGMFLGLFNTLVHCIMYCYYLLTSLSSNYNGIWWKKYITLIQIVQHCLIFMTMFPSVVNTNCSYPKLLIGLFLCGVLYIIHLFVQFYQKTYLVKNKTS